MIQEEETGWRERQRVLLVAAGVTLVFGLTDVAILGRVAPGPVLVRLLWAGLTAWLAWRLPRASEAERRGLFYLGGVAAGVCFPLLVQLTGGMQSPMFHWILATPVLVAVLVQEFPGATLAAGGCTLAGGLLIQWAAGETPGQMALWLVLAAAMVGLAGYASVTYRRLRLREDRLVRDRIAALERAVLLEDERQARATAEEAVQARDEFLSVASHELKAPLTALKAHVQLLRRRGVEAPTLPVIERQVDRLGVLVDGLLDTARLRSGQLTLTPEDLDLAALVRDLGERLRGQVEQAGCTFTVETPGELPGSWDRLRVEQVVTNLVANACKYGQGRPVVLSLSGADPVLLSVRDQGIGVALSDQHRIFDRFERAVSERHFGGLGLGLWISRRLARAMSGDVLLESQPGQGSTFTLVLPRQVSLPVAPAVLPHPVESLRH